MSVIPKELIFKNRDDIDSFLSEPGLNSRLYGLLLRLREPDSTRNALNVKPLVIFNEAYGQALRVIVDKHPEDDYMSKYFDNEVIYLKLKYEIELVFCVVHALLRFSMIGMPNVARFMQVLEYKMKDNTSYFPAILEFEESIINDPDYDPLTDRFYLRTDVIDTDYLQHIDWYLVTSHYSECGIRNYLNFAVDLDYQLAILKAIEMDYKFNSFITGKSDPEFKPLLEKLESACRCFKTIITPLPVVDSDMEVLPLECSVQSQPQTPIVADSKDKVIRVRDIFELAQRSQPSVKKELLNALQLLLAEEDEDWQEMIKIELQANSSDKDMVECKYRITNRKTTDFIKIVSAMLDLHFFSTPDGLLAQSKKDVIVNIGKLFGADLSNYSATLSSAKNTGNFLNIFKELYQAAEEYYNT